MPASGILSQSILNTPKLKVTRFYFAAGAAMDEHTTTRHALVQIMQGVCYFSVEGQLCSLKAGDSLYMQPHKVHALCAREQGFCMHLTTWLE